MKLKHFWVLFIWFSHKPNEHTDDYHNRKPKAENFPSEIEKKNIIMWEKKLVSFETKDRKVEHSSEHGFNDVKYSFAYNEEKIYFVLHQKISLFKNIKRQQKWTSISFCLIKMMI